MHCPCTLQCGSSVCSTAVGTCAFTDHSLMAASPLLAVILISSLLTQGQSDSPGVGFFHSLDQGATWQSAGAVEGNLKDGEVTILRSAMSSEELKQLASLAKQDRFYLVRLGSHATTSVRASCWAAPSATESFKLAITEGQITGVSYTVNSPTCDAAVAPGTAVHAPPTQPVQTQVVGPVLGPALSFDRTLTQAPGGINQRGGVNPGLGGGQKGSGSVGGVTNRPLGGGEAVAGQGEQAGGQQQQQPAQEQTWLQKNWMFVAGGVMVALNVLTAGARQQAPGGAGAGGGGGAARR